MKKYIFIFYGVCLSMLGVAAQAASISDDFNRADTVTATGNLSAIGSWENSGLSTWKIGGNELVPVSKTGSYFYALNNALGTTDGAFTLKGTVIMDTANTAAYLGMTWNHQDESNNYVFRYYITGTTQVLRNSAAEGFRVIKNSTAFTPVNGRGYEITITSAAIHSFALTIMDTVTGATVYTTSWTDIAPSLSGGTAGFWGNAVVGTFDDFSLETIPEPVVQLPFLETFEAADGVATGTVNGQHGWILNHGSADVQSNVYQAGSQALQVQTAEVSHELSSSNSAMWIHFQVLCEEAPATNPSVTDANTSLAFFVNTNLNLVVYSNTIPIELSAQIQTNVWTRFDIYCDYDDQYWDLSMDGINVASGLPLYSTNQQLGSILIANNDASPVYIDQIDIADTEQTSGGLPDSDSDEIPDWWEQKHFGGVASIIADDISGNDGLTYLQTYIAGVSPTTFDPFVVSSVDGGNGLRWNPIQSRLYSVYWSPSLMDEFLLQQEILYPQAEFIDSIHTEEAAGFYRLKVQIQ